MGQQSLLIGANGAEFVNQTSNIEAMLAGAFVNETAQVIYTPAISETASAVDTVSTGGTFTSTITESASAADTVASLGTFISVILETASAVDSVSDGGVTFTVEVGESGAAVDTVSAVGPYYADITEIGAALDTLTATRLGLFWFLSFAEVVPAPDDQGPGNTGKLFGDFEEREY